MKENSEERDFFKRLESLFENVETRESFSLNHGTREQIGTLLGSNIVQIAYYDPRKASGGMVILSSNDGFIREFKKKRGLRNGTSRKVHSTSSSSINSFNFLTGTTFTITPSLKMKIVRHETIGDVEDTLERINERMRSITPILRRLRAK